MTICALYFDVAIPHIGQRCFRIIDPNSISILMWNGGKLYRTKGISANQNQPKWQIYIHRYSACLISNDSEWFPASGIDSGNCRELLGQHQEELIPSICEKTTNAIWSQTRSIIFVRMRFGCRSKALKISFQTVLESHSYENYRPGLYRFAKLDRCGRSIFRQ